MRKNRFCTFTLIVALAIAALPASLAAAGGTDGAGGASASSLPVQQNMTLTITPGTNGSYDPAGSKYTAYRVMSFTRGNDGNWTWAWVNGFHSPAGVTLTADSFGSYPAAKLQNLAEQMALQVDDTTMTDRLAEQALTGTPASCSWTTDKAGIYLVCETETRAGNFPAKPFLAALPYTDETEENRWNYDLTASPKGSEVGLTKVIHDAKGSYLNTAVCDNDKDTVAVGDTVQYVISTRIPAYTSVFFEDGKNPTFRLTDTMAKGLTLNESSITLSSGNDTLQMGADKDYTRTIAEGTGGATVITISLTPAYLADTSHHGKELVLSCSAVVNDNVSLAADGNENRVTLDYSYDPLHPDDTTQIDDTTHVYSFGIEVEKFDGDVDGATKVKLAGAQFELYKETAAGCTAEQALAGQPYRTVQVTGSDGLADFKALDAGTYYLKEVKAPDGYSLLMNPIKVEIIPASAEGTNGAEKITSGDFTVKVNGSAVSASGGEGTTRILNAADREGTVVVAAANHRGFSLPVTGGSGITLILLISAAGLTAAIALYARGDRKKNTTEGVLQK